jgi:hypothetical protein
MPRGSPGSRNRRTAFMYALASVVVVDLGGQHGSMPAAVIISRASMIL